MSSSSRNFNLAAWVENLGSFLAGLKELPGESEVAINIEPPLDEAALTQMIGNWKERGSNLPGSLRRFWLEGASRIDCHYWWTPPPSERSALQEVFPNDGTIGGRVRFLSPERIFPINSVEPDEEKFELEWGSDHCLGELGLKLWRRSAVFLFSDCGDCLGLDPQTNPEDPAVVYLQHDGEDSGQIAPSFTEFLETWAELCFIGPEWWTLEYWLDKTNRRLDPTMHKTRELRALLSPRRQ